MDLSNFSFVLEFVNYSFSKFLCLPDGPGGPFDPAGPSSPLSPRFPGSPAGPFSPTAPAAPGSPRKPCEPGEPIGPCVNCKLKLQRIVAKS